MQAKFMQLPRTVLVGKNVIKNSNDVCSDLNLQGRVLIVSGPTTYKIAGKKLCNILGEEHDTEIIIANEGSIKEVENVKKIVFNKNIAFIAAIGGGRVIDIAKLVSKETGRDFLSIPTAASHDGIASSRSSLKHEGTTVSIRAKAPLGVIADIKIIKSAPYRLIASGCGDIISKFTAVKDWQLSNQINGEEISEYACALSLMTAKMVMDYRYKIKNLSEKSVRNVVKALISSGVAMSIANSSRPASGSEHKFSHALNEIALYPGLHGEQCGIGSIMMMYLHKGGWEDIKDALKEIGAPTTAAEIGVKKEQIIETMTKACKIRSKRYTILDEIRLNRRKAESIAKITGVID
jgi:glycerol-1-phosphate dehydrogenase [NAD(P)+]